MRRPGPGKFEGCEDERLAQVLYDLVQSNGQEDECGDVQENGTWYGLVYSRNRRGGYIVSEDSQGFFDYVRYDDPKQLRAVWRNTVSSIEEEYEALG